MPLYCSNPDKRYRLDKKYGTIEDANPIIETPKPKLVGTISGEAVVTFKRKEAKDLITKHFGDNDSMIDKATNQLSDHVNIHVLADLDEHGELINLRIV